MFSSIKRCFDKVCGYHSFAFDIDIATFITRVSRSHQNRSCFICYLRYSYCFTSYKWVQVLKISFFQTWILPMTPVDSILLATLTVFPQMSYCGFWAPTTPATTHPFNFNHLIYKNMKNDEIISPDLVQLSIGTFGSYLYLFAQVGSWAG